MNNKVKTLVALSVSSLMVAAAAVGTSKGGFFKGVFGEAQPVVWKHYSSIAPTDTEKGIKEYWVSCDDSAHVFEEPTGNVTIQEGSWTEALKASVVATDDDRVIAVRDLETYVYQSASFASKNVVTTHNANSNHVVDAANKTISFRAGEESGGSIVDGKYVPNGGDNWGSFNIATGAINAGLGAGYKYMVFTVKAVGVLNDGQFKSNYYALTSNGGDWAANYTECTVNFNKGKTFCIDLSLYSTGFTNPSLTVQLRNQDYPGNANVVADVDVSNIAYTNINYNSYINEHRDYTNVMYSLNKEELLDTITVNTEAKAGTFSTNTGIKNNYFGAVAGAKGYEEISADLTWTNCGAGNLYYWHISGDQYNNVSSLTMTPETDHLYLSFAKGGGAAQVEGTVTVRFGYSSFLQPRDFYGQTVSAPYGLDCEKIGGTYTGGGAGASGSGTTGEAVCTGGAGVKLYNASNPSGFALTTAFYANYLHICDYVVPAAGDTVIFAAGTYTDHENPWGLARTLTLTEDVSYTFDGTQFLRVMSSAS